MIRIFIMIMIVINYMKILANQKKGVLMTLLPIRRGISFENCSVPITLVIQQFELMVQREREGEGRLTRCFRVHPRVHQKVKTNIKELSGARHPICQWRHPEGSPQPAIPRDDGTDWMDGWSRSSRAWSQRYNRVGPWPSSHGKSILDTESQNKDKTYLTLLYLPPPSGPLLIFIGVLLFKLGVGVLGGTGVIVACASRRVQKWRNSLYRENLRQPLFILEN